MEAMDDVDAEEIRSVSFLVALEECVQMEDLCSLVILAVLSKELLHVKFYSYSSTLFLSSPAEETVKVTCLVVFYDWETFPLVPYYLST
jgi:hypothetical protein